MSVVSEIAGCVRSGCSLIESIACGRSWAAVAAPSSGTRERLELGRTTRDTAAEGGAAPWPGLGPGHVQVALGPGHLQAAACPASSHSGVKDESLDEDVTEETSAFHAASVHWAVP